MRWGGVNADVVGSAGFVEVGLEASGGVVCTGVSVGIDLVTTAGEVGVTEPGIGEGVERRPQARLTKISVTGIVRERGLFMVDWG